ncbi:MAG TPA: hypothetical protein DFS52_22555 [Myxococcales bacterium]|jgi:hypothetical protein|nr:hypothetical protein [Myxococcales bacterium]
MRRLIAATTLALSLGLVPSLANAQQQQQQQDQASQQDQQQMGQQQMGGQMEIRDQRPTSIVAVAKGTVTGLNLSRGLITISTGRGNLTLNALPSQIADLNPGDLVALSYNNYNGVRWLALNQSAGGGIGGAGATSLDPQAFGQYGVVTGYVTQLNKNNGTITVRNVPFRTHPQFLENLLPGQFVNVTFAQVGNINWAQQINPVGAQAPSLPGQQQQGGQQ